MTNSKERHPMATVRSLCLVAVLGVTSLAACSGDDSPSSARAVCGARSDVSSAFEDMKKALADGNFGDAGDEATAMAAAFRDLGQAAGDLAGDEADALRSDIDDLSSSITGLADIESEEELATAVDGIGDQLDALLDEISESQDC